MILNFVKSSSTIRPADVDETSSPNVTYIHENIKEVTRQPIEGEEGEPETYFEYDEAVLTKEEYQLYLQAQESEQLRADVDYVMLMGGF